ncbi:S-adenosyl-L-methionine-dependent methyltransferase [Myxozyma melibiosi]|uniref:S-adenosyl-L-methionine-dependent methyltransferase n=1 Tax=Myxozyma melibiosi TaxID=54550 RepID=A0ABR1FCQ9_9ASCO
MSLALRCLPRRLPPASFCMLRYASTKTQLPPPDPNRRRIPRKTYIPPERQVVKKKKIQEKGIGPHNLSPEEMKRRQRKFIVVAAGVYLLFVAGAYYYLTYGVAADAGNYEDAKPRDTREIYDNLAEDYDSIINRDEQFMLLSLWRKDVTKQLKGDVLEVGCGTGRNMKYLDLPGKVSSMTFVDTSANMVAEAEKSFKKRYPKYQYAEFKVSRTEDLPTDKKFDVIYETFGICSYEDPVAALKHMQELLKPGGRIILLEHGRGTWDFINRILDKNAASRSEVFGCRWNLDIGEIVRQSGLVIDHEERWHLGTTWTIFAHREGEELPVEPKKRFLIW